MPERYPHASAQVALTGATHVTVVAAPPIDVAYHITRVMGQNGAGAARTLHLVFKKVGTRTVVWESANVNDGVMFAGTLGAENTQIDITLADTDEILEAVLSDAGTDTIVVSYEILEA